MATWKLEEKSKIQRTKLSFQEESQSLSLIYSPREWVETEYVGRKTSNIFKTLGSLPRHVWNVKSWCSNFHLTFAFKLKKKLLLDRFNILFVTKNPINAIFNLWMKWKCIQIQCIVISLINFSNSLWAITQTNTICSLAQFVNWFPPLPQWLITQYWI